MNQSPDIDWERIQRELCAPFPFAETDFRPQGKLGSNGRGRVVGYIDARAVQARLDTVVGCQNWTFTWDVIALDQHLRAVKGRITIHGIPKEDVGDSIGQATEPTKSAVSDAEKRAAVQWGIGRGLYELSLPWVEGNPGSGAGDNNWTISEAGMNTLRRHFAQQPTAPQAPAPASAPVVAPAPPAAATRPNGLPELEDAPPKPIGKPALLKRVGTAREELGWAKEATADWLNTQLGTVTYQAASFNELERVVLVLEALAAADGAVPA